MKLQIDFAQDFLCNFWHVVPLAWICIPATAGILALLLWKWPTTRRVAIVAGLLACVPLLWIRPSTNDHDTAMATSALLLIASGLSVMLFRPSEPQSD